MPPALSKYSELTYRLAPLLLLVNASRDNALFLDRATTQMVAAYAVERGWLKV